MLRKVLLVGLVLTFLVALYIRVVLPPSVSMAEDQTAQMESQLRALTPPRVTQLAESIEEERGAQAEVQISFRRADLDGTGEFDFIIAAYTTFVGGTLRVLRERDGQLEVVADLDADIDVGGSNFEIDLADVDNDGRPEVLTRGHGAAIHYTLAVFGWTGSTLRLLTEAIDTVDAELEDVDGDGRLEIVTPPECDNKNENCVGEYRVYRFNGLSFELASTSPTPPQEGVSVLARRALMNPRQFPLAEVRLAGQPDASVGGVVTVRLGNLSELLTGLAISISEVDMPTLRLGRTMRPLRTEILPADQDDWAGQGQGTFNGPFLQAQFGRQELLRFLPRLQFSKPLEPGDKLGLELRGKMKNGAPLLATVQVEIVAE
ncbi:MAG: FG-GAP repeat domain-containing protein [bacterium]